MYTQTQQMAAVYCTRDPSQPSWHAFLDKESCAVFSTKMHTSACITGNAGQQRASRQPSLLGKQQAQVMARVATVQDVYLQPVWPLTALEQCITSCQVAPCRAAPNTVRIYICCSATLSCVFLAFNVVHCSIHTISSIVNAAHTTTPGILQPKIAPAAAAAAAELTTMVHRTP